MGNGYAQPIRPPSEAYPRWKRVRHALWIVLKMKALGPQKFEATKSKEIAKTYGLDAPLIKRMKAKHRNELSFVGEGK